jgi:autotransporter-associated beta strand protein
VGNTTQLGGTGGLGQIVLTYPDPPVNVKADNTDNLNLTSSWTAHVPHALIAEWNSTVLGPNTTSLGANLTIAGIKISDPGGPVTINAGNTLTLGAAAIDLDLSSATQDLTVNSDLAMSAANVWDVAATRALTLGGAVSGSVAVTKQGLGTATLSGLSATAASNYSGTTTLNGGTLALTTTSPSLTGGLTFGATPGTLDLSGVASSATFAGAMSAPTNSASSNTIVIGSGKTLNINGNVTVGANVASAVGSLVTSGGGNLVVGTGGATNFQIGGVTGGTLGGSTSVDLSSLASFTFNSNASGTLRLGDNTTGSNSPSPSTLKLATDNTITVGNFRIGDGSGGQVTHVLTLGNGANIINATTTNIGSAGAGIRSGGSVVFDGADTTGTLTLRGFAGVGTRTTLNMVSSTGNTQATMNSILNMAGHTANVDVSTLTMAGRTSGGGATSTLTFDQGTLDVTTLNMSNRSGTATTTTATVNLGDSVAVGVPTVTIGGITMAVSASAGTAAANLNISGGNVGITSINMANAGAAATATSNINLTGGTTTLAGNITRTGGAGTENATLKISGGTLNMGGFNIGGAAAITLTAESGTLQNLAELNGGGALTKTTTGTLVLTGTNTYSGGTNVNAGTLLLSGAFNMPATGTLQVNAGGTFSLADGPASTTTTTAALGLASGATLTFDWNGSSLDMLTSTNAATTAGTVFIGLNNTSPTGSGGTIISSPLGGLSGAGYFLVNPIDFTAPILVTDTAVSIGTITTGVTPLTDAYWLGGQLTGGGLGAMALSTGAASNWATDAAGTSTGGLVPGGSAVNVIFGASAATEQASVTTGANLNLGSITFNDSAAVTIGGSHAITLNSTSPTAATSSGSGTTVTPGSSISVTSSANAANAINANLALAANQTWNVASGKTLSIGGTVSGSGSLTKADAGTLVLSSSNTYSGGTTISASGGTLQASIDATTSLNALGAGAVDVGAGSTLVLNNLKTTNIADTIANTFTGSGLLKLQFDALATPRNTSLTNVAGFGGTIQLSSLGTTGDKWNALNVGTMAGSLVVDSGNTIFVNGGPASFAGGMTINGGGNTDNRGAIRIGGATTVLGGNISLADSSTISMENVAAQITGDVTSGAAGTQTLTLGGTASAGGLLSGIIGGGTGTINLATAVGGTYTLTNTSTYTGSTAIAANTTLQLGNGTTGNDGTIANTSGVTNDGTLVFDRFGTSTAAYNISGTGGVTKRGAGTQILAGNNSYSGNNTIFDGTLRMGAANGIPTLSGLEIGGGSTVASTLDLDGFDQTLSKFVFNATDVGGNLTITGGAASKLTVTTTTDTELGAGGTNIAANRPVTVDMSGLGEFAWDGAANTFRVGLRSGTSNASSTNPGTMTTTLAGTNTIKALSLAIGTIAASNNGGTSILRLGQTNVLNADSLLVGTGSRTNATLDFRSGLTAPTVTIRGTDGLSRVADFNLGLVQHTATVTWTANADFSAGEIDALVNSMRIGVANTGSSTGRAGIENATFTMGKGTLDVTSLIIGQYASGVGGTVASTGTFAGNGIFNLNDSTGIVKSESIILADNIGTATGAATKIASGTFNLNAGTLETKSIDCGTQTGNADTVTRNFNFSDGTLRNYTGFDLAIANVPINLTGSGTRVFEATTGQSITVASSSVISGTGTGFTKQGGGTLTLSGANTYTGTTSVSQGTLALVGGSQASPITVSEGASLSFAIDSPTTSTSSFDLTEGTIKITGTPSAASHILITSSTGITGTPTLDVPVPGYELKVVGNSLVLEQAGYGSWAALNGAGANLNEDHDNDGVANGVEYFLGGPNGNTTGFTVLPGVTNTAGALSVTWVMGTGYAGVYGTDFSVETSDTLTGAWAVETLGGNVAVSGRNVTYTFPAPLGTKKFARLKVTGP